MKTSVTGVEPKWIAVFIFFLIGVVLGGFAIYLYAQATLPLWIKDRLATGEYHYINSLITASASDIYGNFNGVNKELEQNITGLVARSTQGGGITTASVYYRSLTAGEWLDIGAERTFSPGAFLKIPLMIAYYKLAEKDPQILSDTIHFNGSFISQETLFGTTTPLAPNQDYAAGDLIQKMVDESNETAASLLYDHIDKGTLGEIYSDLGIDSRADSAGRYMVSLKRYGSFFRRLYSADFLSPQYSENALSLLAQNTSNSLLEEGVPRSVSIVYRTGGKTIASGGVRRVEVYECDIVYIPKGEYLLCALADGQQLESIRTLFSAVGSAIYNSVSSQKETPGVDSGGGQDMQTGQ